MNLADESIKISHSSYDESEKNVWVYFAHIASSFFFNDEMFSENFKLNTSISTIEWILWFYHENWFWDPCNAIVKELRKGRKFFRFGAAKFHSLKKRKKKKKNIVHSISPIHCVNNWILTLNDPATFLIYSDSAICRVFVTFRAFIIIPGS